MIFQNTKTLKKEFIMQLQHWKLTFALTFSNYTYKKTFNQFNI